MNLPSVRQVRELIATTLKCEETFYTGSVQTKGLPKEVPCEQTINEFFNWYGINHQKCKLSPVTPKGGGRRFTCSADHLTYFEVDEDNRLITTESVIYDPDTSFNAYKTTIEYRQ